MEAGGDTGSAYYHTGIGIVGGTKKVSVLGWVRRIPGLKVLAADGQRDMVDEQVDN